MILNTSSVDLEGITSSVPRSQFDENELEYLANLFLKSGDTVRPILLHEKSPIAFEILEGHREYYAALKAQEIDARFEAIRAYIVPSDRQDSILEQYEYFCASKPVLPPSNKSSTQSISISDIKKCIAEEISPLKANLSRALTAIAEINEQVKLVKTLTNNSGQLIFDETNLESVLEKVVEKVIVRHLDTIKSTNTKTAKSSAKSSKQEQETTFINELNTYDASQLKNKMLQAGYSDNYAESYATKLHNYRMIRNYESIADIQSRKDSKGKPLLTETTLTRLIKNW